MNYIMTRMMTLRTKRYILRKKRGIVWQNYGNMVRLSDGSLLYVLQDEPVQQDGGWVYTVKLVDNDSKI